MRHITPQRCAQLSCISLFLIFTCPSAAQIRPAPGTRQDIPNREWALSNLRKDLRPDISVEREARILLMTLKDDFRQLQIVNNELMDRTFIQSRNNPKAITSKEIRSSLGEIHKRAGRLRTNLRLPEVKTRKDDISEDRLPGRTMLSSLLILDETVMKVVENPIFQQPGVFDAQHSLRAAEDLNKILRLTDFLRKLAKEDPSLQLAKQDPKK